MNIKQALKEKNKLVKQISESFSKVQSYNSVEAGSNRPYDPVASLEEWKNNIDKLIDLKTRIHRANAKVYDKIFRLAELKSMVKQLKSVNCQEGKISNYRREEPLIMESAISLVEKDTMVKAYEAEIEKLQEELDAHNAKTSVPESK